jgi:hypothetical protein
MTEPRYQYAIISSSRRPLPGWEDRGLVQIVDTRRGEGERRLIRQLLPSEAMPSALHINGSILSH